MDLPHPTPRPGRLLRWVIAIAVVGVLLAIYWVVLDRVATRVGQDAQSTFRTAPISDDSRHRTP